MDRRTFLASASAASAFALVPEALRAQRSTALPASPADAKLNALFDKIFAQTLQRSPELATSLGMDKGANAALKRQLSDGSAAGKAAARAELKQAIAAVRAVDPAPLSPRAKLDQEVVLYSLETRAVPYDRFKLDGVQRPFTIFQQGGSYFSTPDFLNSSHTINTAEDCEAYLSRLGAFAKRLDQDTADQKEEAARGYLAPDFSLDLTLAQMAKLRSFAPAQSGLAQSVAGPDRRGGDLSCARPANRTYQGLAAERAQLGGHLGRATGRRHLRRRAGAGHHHQIYARGGPQDGP